MDVATPASLVTRALTGNSFADAPTRLPDCNAFKAAIVTLSELD
jgi:hypothetical protein